MPASTRSPFSYAVVRVVPHVEREELRMFTFRVGVVGAGELRIGVLSFRKTLAQNIFALLGLLLLRSESLFEALGVVGS